MKLCDIMCMCVMCGSIRSRVFLISNFESGECIKFGIHNKPVGPKKNAVGNS